MLSFLSILGVIKAKILLLKSLVLAFVAPYVGASLAAALFYILSAVVSLFLVYMAVMAIIKIGGVFASKTTMPVVEKKVDETNKAGVNKDNTSELPGKKVLPGKDDTGIPVVEENVSELSSENVLPVNRVETEVTQQDSGDDSDDEDELDSLISSIVVCSKGSLRLSYNSNNEELARIDLFSSLNKEELKEKLIGEKADDSNINVNIILNGTSKFKGGQTFVYYSVSNIKNTPQGIVDLVEEILTSANLERLSRENNVNSGDSSAVQSDIVSGETTDNKEDGSVNEGGLTTSPNSDQPEVVVSGGGDSSEEHDPSSTSVMNAITDKLDQAAILYNPCTFTESEEVQERIDSKDWDEIIKSFSNSGKDNVIFEVEDGSEDQIILHAEEGNIELSGSLLGKLKGITDLSKSICIGGEGSLSQTELEKILNNLVDKQVTVSSETENSEGGQVVLPAAEDSVKLSKSILLTTADITDLSKAMLTTAEARAEARGRVIAMKSLMNNVGNEEESDQDHSGSSGFYSADGSDASRQSPNSEENLDVESSDNDNKEEASEEGSVDLVNAPLHSSAIPNGSLVQPVVKQNNNTNGSEEYVLGGSLPWPVLD